MPIEYVTRGITFDNLCVDVTVLRYTCDDCGRRQAFHDVPTPYGESVPTPQSLGWQLLHSFDDDGGQEGARCPHCIADREAKKQELKAPA